MLTGTLDIRMHPEKAQLP